jgi:hypothetical protein
LTVGTPRPQRWSCTLDDEGLVILTIPGREIDTALAREKLRAALKRVHAEVARSRDDAA